MLAKCRLCDIIEKLCKLGRDIFLAEVDSENGFDVEGDIDSDQVISLCSEKNVFVDLIEMGVIGKFIFK